MSRFFFILLFLCSKILFAKEVHETRFMVDIGGGLPQLAGAEFSYRLYTNWHIGVGYGLIPGGNGISPGFSFPSQNVTLANSQFVTFEKPSVTTTLTAISPFIRFHPSSTNFYFQFTIGMLQAKNSFTSQILDISGNLISDASYSGIVNVTQFLPTLSIGRVFASDLFFFNVNMGVTVAATAQVETVLTSELPDRLGGNAGNQQTIDDLKAKSQDAVNSGLQSFRNEVLFLPSIYMALGFMF